MIRVPEGEGNLGHFDPDEERQGHSFTPHVIPIPGAKRIAEEDGVLRSTDTDSNLGGRNDSIELEAARKRGAVFDDASLRNAMTDVHEKGDALESELIGLHGREVNDIRKRTDAFLREEETRQISDLTNNRQKQAFEASFGAYARDMQLRAQSLQDYKTLEYRDDISARQNQVFMDKALASQNLFDDKTQTVLRDMCLLNIDNRNADAPASERNEKLDNFSRDYYKAILDRRLEQDPARTRTMLDAPAVRRVLGDEYLSDFEGKVDRALTDDGMRAAAKEMAQADLDRGEAAQRLGSLYPDEADRSRATEQYEHYRYNRNRDKVVDLAASVDSAWQEMKANGLRRGTIPDAVRRNNPALYEYLEEQIKGFQQNGAHQPKTDYAFLLETIDNFSPRETMERLHNQNLFFEFQGKLGGPDSKAARKLLPAVIGDEGNSDHQWFVDLQTARDQAERKLGRQLEREELNAFMAEFDESRDILTRREDNDRLTRKETRDLADETFDSLFGDPVGDGTAGERPAPPPIPQPSRIGDSVVADIVEQGQIEVPDEIVRPKATDLDYSQDYVAIDNGGRGDNHGYSAQPQSYDLDRDLVPIEPGDSASTSENDSEPVLRRFGDFPLGEEENARKMEMEITRPWEDGGDDFATQGSISLEADDIQKSGIPPSATFSDLTAKKTEDGKNIIHRGDGKIVNFHGNWGDRHNIQSEEILKDLNTFVQDERSREFFPEGTTVRAHPNGDSLVWEWVDKDTDDLVRWQQTARPSYQIEIKDKVGFIAEETPWGFMASERFRTLPDRQKSKIIAHEAYHQMMQIGEQGKIPYLIDIRGQLLLNIPKNALTPASKRSNPNAGIVVNSYNDIRQEQDAFKLNETFEEIFR